MLFRVPLAYYVEGVQKGKRKPTREQYWEYVEIDIPVLNDEISPVAVVWEDSFPFEDCNFRDKDDWQRLVYPPEDGEQMVRYYEGEYYLRRWDRMTPSELAKKFEDFAGDHSHIFGQEFIYYANRDRERPVSEVQYRTDMEYISTFDSDYAKLRARAEEFFIVDNDIFIKSSEPVVSNVIIGIFNQRFPFPRIVPKDKADKRQIIYSLDMFDDAVDACKEYNTRLERDLPYESRRPRIFLDSMPSQDMFYENLLNASERCIENLGKYTSHLGEVKPDYGIAILNLRKGMALYQESGDAMEMEKWAAILVRDHASEVQYTKLESALKELEKKGISIEAGSSYKGNL